MSLLTKDILEAVRCIRPHLSNLLGEEANEVDQELDELFARATAGEEVNDEIQSFLEGYPMIRAWLSGFFTGILDLSYSQSRPRLEEKPRGYECRLENVHLKCFSGDNSCPPSLKCSKHSVGLTPVWE